jgi:hypothetical protein
MLRAMLRRLSTLCIASVALFTPAVRAQVTVNLNSVIGASGTSAASVAGVGNAVNFVFTAVSPGTTTLTAPGSTGSSSFDFNTGFTDTFDRATGISPGSPAVIADRKYDSVTAFSLILDTNNDGSFGGESALTGFGMSGESFITFNLDVIRANNGLSAGTAFTLTGSAGIANTVLQPTSGAIIVDSSQRAVFDWTSGAGNTFSTYSIGLSGSDRYLTFIGLSGLDLDYNYAHVGFANVQLTAVPEPSAYAVLAGLAALGLAALRRRRSQGTN